MAFAGNDTSIVVGQPLQLHGSGAPSFLWYPDFALDRNDISDPVAYVKSKPDLCDEDIYGRRMFCL